MARMTHVKNQVAKQSIPSKVNCHHSISLSEMWKTRGNQRRLTAFWSANFFDDPEMHAEDLPLVDPPRQNEDLQLDIVLLENYVRTKVEARKEDPPNLPGEAKGSLPSRTLLVEPEMSGTTYLCRPV